MHFSQWRIRIGSIGLLGGVAEQRDKLRQHFSTNANSVLQTDALASLLPQKGTTTLSDREQGGILEVAKSSRFLCNAY
ncbi:MAG: hypothetical protein KME55_08600 [Nostoc indistinguendum CM1-VF10]|jgi:hypothetical protein|nr:hypothetical protein [Nostoc indistinguendum CM1-VF10]